MTFYVEYRSDGGELLREPGSDYASTVRLAAEMGATHPFVAVVSWVWERVHLMAFGTTVDHTITTLPLGLLPYHCACGYREDQWDKVVLHRTMAGLKTPDTPEEGART